MFKLIIILFICTILCTLLVLLRNILQQKLLFKPTKCASYTIKNTCLKEFNFQTSDKETLYGLIYTAPPEINHNNKYVLYSHGNSGNIYEKIDDIFYVSNLFNANVIMYDYRGYGKSTGTPSEQGLYTDALSVWKYMQEVLHISPSNVILYGRSLGCSPTLKLATVIQKKGSDVRAIILVAGFSSLKEIVSDVYPFLKVLVFNEFNNIAMLSEIYMSIPIYILHSKTDELISYKHAEKLYKCINKHDNCILMEIEGTHGDIIIRNEIKKILKKL